MSRIEPRTLPQSQTQPGGEVPGGRQVGEVAGASRAVSVTRTRRKPARETKELQGKLRKIAGSKEVLASDVTPLRGRRKEQLIGEIARIIEKIERFEEDDPDDKVTLLCKVMLREHMRRLSLVVGTQVESNSLGGEV
ncbi:MAG: hypothetical protein AAFN43_11035 [Pseudomonadota bacterium]